MSKILKMSVAKKIQEAVLSLLPAAKTRINVHDTYHKLPDGSNSDLYDRYSVEVTLRDARTGNGETRVIDEMPQDVAGLCKDMDKKVRASAKRTKAVVRTENFLDTE